MATIQGEQDEVIRAPLAGVLVVQGGPGTGKTVVALHRAAYLLYTHRFPLEGQGVLVVGPNRLFLSYIDQVLPSLGEAGVHTAVIGDLIPDTRVAITESLPVARIKGDLRMVPLLRKAVKDRQRALREPLVVPFGLQRLRLSVAGSREIVADVRRRASPQRRAADRLRNGCSAGWPSARASRSPRRPALASATTMRCDMPWVDVAGAERLGPAERPVQLPGAARVRRRGPPDRRRVGPAGQPPHDDPPSGCGPLAMRRSSTRRWCAWGARPNRRDSDVIRTYGHILVDEAQDLSPMELRSLSRRSLGGSMTVVGDIAQATSPWAHDSWDDVIDALPKRRPAAGGTEHRLPTARPHHGPGRPTAPLAAPGPGAAHIDPRTGPEPVIDQVNDCSGEPRFDEVLVGAVQREVSAVGQGAWPSSAPAVRSPAARQALTKAGVTSAVQPGMDWTSRSPWSTCGW
ncbi:MAG: hypothetical protein IPQ14_04425 [Candidatus Microthrix sp.]|uniref:DNA/RNA helicase domain-containing protein n=1 Tax=Candidatus Neomicrothrix sp. TaxID=2719034 RepID=UPI0025BDD7F3|nr:DNA/RNA helicase domain-containing protein [Candidatus Microthrix sp.]MBL0203575.1 hypothetical protein [Candidatus Microthrix sp.]